MDAAAVELNPVVGHGHDLDPFGRQLDITEWPTKLRLLYGGYAHAGLNFRIGSLLLGVDGRALFWADDHVNYLQAAFTIGYAF